MTRCLDVPRLSLEWLVGQRYRVTATDEEVYADIRATVERAYGASDPCERWLDRCASAAVKSHQENRDTFASVGTGRIG